MEKKDCTFECGFDLGRGFAMRRKKVLVVDNNSVFLALIEKFLTKSGYQVWTADNSISALDAVKKIRPGIIFIDLIMPDIDGAKLCRKIRDSLPLKNTKIILISALAVEQIINYAEWGFDACIAKGPFDRMTEKLASFLKSLDRGRIEAEQIGFENIYPREITKELLSIKTGLETILSNISEGVLQITEEGRVLYANPAAIEILGKTELELLASDFLKLFKRSDQKRAALALNGHRAGKGDQGDYLLGNGRRVSISAAGAGEKPKKYIIVISDVTEKRLAETALLLHSEFEKLVMDISTRFINLSSYRVDQGITEALGKIGRFANVDRSYVFQFSDSGKMMRNTHEWCARGIEPQMDRLKGLDMDAMFPWFSKKIKQGSIIHLSRIKDLPKEARREKTEFTRQGIQSMVNVPMVSGEKIVGFVGFDSVRQEKKWPEEMIMMLKIVGEILINAINRGTAEKALRDSEKKFRELADLLPQIVFETDRDGYLTFANRQAIEAFGPAYSQDRAVPALNFVLPEDRARAAAHFQRILRGENLPAPEFSFKNRDGSISAMVVYSARIREQNRTVGLRGITNDITERKRWEDLYRSLAEKSFAGVYVLVKGSFKYMNETFAAFTGYSPEELVTMKAISIIHPDDKKTARENAVQMLKGLRKSPYEFRILRKDGSIRWAVETVSSIYYEGQWAVLGNIMDLTERKTSEEQLKYLSTHDNLTKLYNRAYFEAEVERLEHGRRFPINVLMADIDYLKETNDSLGHQAGDELLRRAAAVLKQGFRKEDVIARIGGDEFAAIWTDSGQSTGRTALKRIGKSLAEHNKKYPDSPLRLSVGIASGLRGCKVSDLMRQADQKMYEQKALGKKTVSSLESRVST